MPLDETGLHHLCKCGTMVSVPLSISGVSTCVNRGFCTRQELGPSRRRDCHFADAPSPSVLKRLRKVEGVQQNDGLADG